MTSELPDIYKNLLKDGTLNIADRDIDEINQYIEIADQSLKDAKNAGMFPHGRYILAYEGLHSLAIAVLMNYGVRPGNGPGHRSVALQKLCDELKLDAGARKSVMDTHNRRNEKTYRSALPPVTHKEAEAVIAILKDVHFKVRELIPLKTD
jgi:uncharacterized protein (UPF0332 family)